MGAVCAVNESASPKFAVGDRVRVPSAQRATMVSEVVSQDDSFGFRLAGLGQEVIAETDMEGNGH